MKQLWFVAFMVVLWCLLQNSFAVGHILVGLAAASMSAFLVREQVDQHLSARRYFRHPLRLLYITGIFIYELVLGSIAIAKMLLQPRSKWTYAPGIIAVPLDTRDEVEITLFANMITMIPGTVAVDVSEDRSTLYMHVLDASDPEDHLADPDKGFQVKYVKRAFEKPIMWAMEQ